jgi:hypothetical protein
LKQLLLLELGLDLNRFELKLKNSAGLEFDLNLMKFENFDLIP